MMYASVEAVAEQWRPLDTRETAVATRLLDRVSALMRQASPGLAGRIALNPDLAVIVQGIAVDAVLRVLRAMSVDLSSASAAEIVSQVSESSLHLTDAEIAALQSSAPSDAAPGAFTIRPGGRGPVWSPC